MEGRRPNPHIQRERSTGPTRRTTGHHATFQPGKEVACTSPTTPLQGPRPGHRQGGAPTMATRRDEERRGGDARHSLAISDAGQPKSGGQPSHPLAPRLSGTLNLIFQRMRSTSETQQLGMWKKTYGMALICDARGRWRLNTPSARVRREAERLASRLVWGLRSAGGGFDRADRGGDEALRRRANDGARATVRLHSEHRFGPILEGNGWFSLVFTGTWDSSCMSTLVKSIPKCLATS